MQNKMTKKAPNGVPIFPFLQVKEEHRTPGRDCFTFRTKCMFIILIDFLSIFLQDSLGLNLFVCLLFLYVDFFLFVTCQQYYREIDHSMISRIVSRQFEVYKGQGHKPSVHGQLVVIHIIPQYYWHVVLQILSKFHRKRRGRLNENKMDQKKVPHGVRCSGCFTFRTQCMFTFFS